MAVVLHNWLFSWWRFLAMCLNLRLKVFTLISTGRKTLFVRLLMSYIGSLGLRGFKSIHWAFWAVLYCLVFLSHVTTTISYFRLWKLFNFNRVVAYILHVAISRHLYRLLTLFKILSYFAILVFYFIYICYSSTHW
jgi:hypothetical protein